MKMNINKKINIAELTFETKRNTLLLALLLFNTIGFTISQPINGQCQSAIGPLAVGGSMVLGSTVGGAINYTNIGLSRCANQIVNFQSPGAWYYIDGRTARLRASTCSASTNFTNRISVFSGKQCDSRICINTGAEPDPACTYGNATGVANGTYVEWDALPNMTYYILVHNVKDTESGVFGLTVKDITKPPENNACTNAILLPDKINPLQGTTAGAAINTGAMRCTGGEDLYPGVWYQIPAKDVETEATLSICSSYLSFNISTYVGSCGAMDCADSTLQSGLNCSGGNGLATTSEWIAEPGKTYNVLIYASRTVGDQNVSPFVLVFSRTSYNGTNSTSASGPGINSVTFLFGFIAALATTISFNWL